MTLTGGTVVTYPAGAVCSRGAVIPVADVMTTTKRV